MDMNKLTLKSQEALAAAAKLAAGSNHQAIGPEHLLKALASDPGGLVFGLMQKLGVAPRTLNDRVDELLARIPKVYGSGQATIGVPFRPLIVNFATLYFFIVYRLPADELRRTTQGVTALLAEGALRHPAPKVFALEQIAAAHELVERGADGKVLVRL